MGELWIGMGRITAGVCYFEHGKDDEFMRFAMIDGRYSLMLHSESHIHIRLPLVGSTTSRRTA